MDGLICAIPLAKAATTVVVTPDEERATTRAPASAGVGIMTSWHVAEGTPPHRQTGTFGGYWTSPCRRSGTALRRAWVTASGHG